MLDIFGAKIVWAFLNLQLLSEVAKGEKRDFLGTAEGLGFVRLNVGPIEQLCRSLGLETAVVHAGYLMVAGQSLLTPDVVAQEVAELERHLKSDLNTVMFESIPKLRGGYYRLAFEPLIQTAFPLSAHEIAEGGTCLALGRTTASVFHMVRAAEYGLRALARAAGVKRKPSLEFREWGDLIRRIEDRIRPINQGKWPRPIVSVALEFYSGALADARALNDSVRKLIMHTRKQSFTEPEAISVILRVRDFLGRLAGRGVSEVQARMLLKRDFKP